MPAGLVALPCPPDAVQMKGIIMLLIENCKHGPPTLLNRALQVHTADQFPLEAVELTICKMVWFRVFCSSAQPLMTWFLCGARPAGAARSTK